MTLFSIRNLPVVVIPAQAGIHFLNSETVFQIKAFQILRWIPACAGMTEFIDIPDLKLSMLL